MGSMRPAWITAAARLRRHARATASPRRPHAPRRTLPPPPRQHRPPLPQGALRRRARRAGRRVHGGVTAFTRAPATGLWEDDAGEVQRDEVVLFEVMVEQLDHGWWRAYRTRLEGRFRQDEVLVRATSVERL